MAEPVVVAGTPARDRRRLLWSAVAAGTVGVLAGFGVYGWRARSSDDVPETIFWQQRLEMLDGSSLLAASLRGRPLLLNFWATWCPPCVEEMPLLDAFFSQNRQKGHQVLGIALDKPEAVRAFLTRIPVQFPIAIAGFPGAELAKTLGNLGGGLPFSVFFAPDGKIARRKMGKIVEEDLQIWGKISA